MLGKIIVGIVLVVIAAAVIVSAYRRLVPAGEWWSRGSMSTSTLVPAGEYYAPPPAPPLPPASTAPPPSAHATTPTIRPEEIPAGFKAEDISPYFRKLRISVSPSHSSDYPEQIAIYAYLDKGEKAKVTGWRLQGNRGSQIIPPAVNFYEPSGLAPEEDIYLENGHTLYMYSGRSAAGRNLRLNRCTGYLENYLDFVPPLPLSCPSIDRSEISGFSGQCQEVILSIGSCRLPPPNPLLPQNDYACRAFLDTLNYAGCVARWRRTEDFLSKEWRVWYGSPFLDERHDRVLLLDADGKLVDIYVY